MDMFDLATVIVCVVMLYFTLRGDRPEPDRNAGYMEGLIHPIPDALVVLIHGTFASDAAWVGAGSAMRKDLSLRLKGRINFLPFYWSGKNSDFDRFLAARRLVSLIDRIRGSAVYPVVLIGHSHGGTIAIAAARDIDSVRVVTLATPFLHRDVEPPNRLMRHANYRYVPFILTIALMSALIAGVNPWIVLSSGLFTLYLGMMVLPISRDKAEKFGLFREDGYYPEPSLADRTLILRTAGDEATFVIAAMSIVAWVHESIHRVVFVLLDRVEIALNRVSGSKLGTWRKLLIVPCIALLFVLIEWSTLRPAWNSLGQLMQILLQMALGVAVIWVTSSTSLIWWGLTIITMVTLSPLTIAMNLAKWAAVGREASFSSFWVRLSAESSPPGRWYVHYLSQMPVSRKEELERRRPMSFLRHSRLYDDPVALGVIGQWVSENVEVSACT